MPPCLVIQIWDNDKFSADDFLGIFISCRSLTVYSARFRNFMVSLSHKKLVMDKVEKVGPLCSDGGNHFSRNRSFASEGKFLVVPLNKDWVFVYFLVFLFLAIGNIILE